MTRGIRLFHAQRQSLRQQPARSEPVRRRHHGGGALCRPARHAFGLDRRAPFQLARRALLPRSGARLCGGANQAHPAGAGGDGAAAASPDPGGGAMGHARSVEQRARRFRRRPRLRPARISAVPCLVRRQSGHLRGRPRTRPQAVGGGRPHLASRRALFVRRRADHAEAGAAPDPDLCRVVLEALDRARRPARLRPDRGAVRRRHEFWRIEAGRRPLSRDLRQIRPEAGPADVQLFHPLRRQQGTGGGAARPPDPLLQGMRDPGVSRRSRHRAAELPLLHPDRRAAAEDQSGGP